METFTTLTNVSDQKRTKVRNSHRTWDNGKLDAFQTHVKKLFNKDKHSRFVEQEQEVVSASNQCKVKPPKQAQSPTAAIGSSTVDQAMRAKKLQRDTTLEICFRAVGRKFLFEQMSGVVVYTRQRPTLQRVSGVKPQQKQRVGSSQNISRTGFQPRCRRHLRRTSGYYEYH